MLVESLSLVALALVAACVYLRRNFSFWGRQRVPHDRPLPLVGSRLRQFLFLRHEGEDTDRVYRRFPDAPCCGMFEGDEPALLLRAPALVRSFYAHELALPLVRRIREDPGNAFTRSLPFASGRHWKLLRSTMTRGFSTARIRAAFLSFRRNAQLLADALAASDGGAVEVQDLLNCYSVDNVAGWVFGIDVGSLSRPDSDFRHQMNRILGSDTASHLGRLTSWFLQPLFKPLGLSFPGRETMRFMDKVAADLRDARRKDGAAAADDIFQRLLDAEDAGWTPDMVTANSFVLLAAGSDTSGSAMAFSLLELALNGQIQDKLYAEVRAALEREKGAFTYESIQDLKYLDMVISETLRKWPPAVSVGRVASASFVFPGTEVTLKPGTALIIPIYSIHRDPKYYPDPERFDPERFSDEAKARREPYTYLPFSEGPRTCIGLRLALLQSKIGLAQIISKFEVKTCEKTRLPVRISVTGFSTQQKGGTWLRFVKREDCK